MSRMFQLWEGGVTGMTDTICEAHCSIRVLSAWVISIDLLAFMACADSVPLVFRWTTTITTSYPVVVVCRVTSPKNSQTPKLERFIQHFTQSQCLECNE